MEYSGTWKEIWTQKGAADGTKEDILVFDGWEKSNTDIAEIGGKIHRMLDIKPNDKVLEVGCGAGGLAQFMDCNYIGIDFSETLVKRCMEFWQKSAIYAEASDIPFKDGYFDKCFSWGCFLYFPSKEYMKKTVAEMKRVTKGKIFIGDLPKTSHNDRHMSYEEDDFRKLGFSTMDGWAAPYEKVRFNAIF